MTKLPRNILPQIPSDKMEEFLEFVKNNEVSVKHGRAPIIKLKPIQSHINREKVEKIKKNAKTQKLSPILVSKEGFVIDGHHRWVAQRELEEETMDVILINATLKDVISLCYLFDGVQFKGLHENKLGV